MTGKPSAVLVSCLVALFVSCSGSTGSPDAGVGGGSSSGGGGTNASGGGGTSATGGGGTSATGGGGTSASGGGGTSATGGGGTGATGGGGTSATGGGTAAPDAGPSGDAGTLIYFENFDTGALPSRFQAQHGGTVALSTDTTKNYAGSAGSVRGTYPTPGAGDIYVWGGYDVSTYATEEVFVEFRAKMPATKYGLKFCKIFGARSGADTNTYANTTFGLDYTGIDNGSMQYVGFGDGTGLANDTANGVWLDGTTGSKVGRSQGTAVLETPQNLAWASSQWGTDWHLFRLHVKFNSRHDLAERSRRRRGRRHHRWSHLGSRHEPLQPKPRRRPHHHRRAVRLVAEWLRPVRGLVRRREDLARKLGRLKPRYFVFQPPTSCTSASASFGPHVPGSYSNIGLGP